MSDKGEKGNKKIKELLYQSFDSDLNDEEKRILEEALRNSAELRKEKQEIQSQRQALSESAVRSFQPFFAERVMSRIGPASKANGLEMFYESLKAAFRRFVIAGAVIMIALLSYNVIRGDSVSSEEIFYASDTAAEEIIELPLF
jgi:anti-sigma factor RsiW